MRPYERAPAEIYKQSFATVRAEANLDRFDTGMQALAIRLIHACGMVEIADRIAYSQGGVSCGTSCFESRRACVVRLRNGWGWDHSPLFAMR